MNGTLAVLNCGAGHLEFRFDKGDPLEVEKARRVIQDMLTRGYSIFVQQPDGLAKIEGFDPATDCYVISDAPAPPGGKPKKGKGGKRRVPMREAHATGVGPTAGG